MPVRRSAHSDALGDLRLTRTSDRVSVKVNGGWVSRNIWSWDEDDCTTREFVLVDGVWHELSSGGGPVREIATWEHVAYPSK